MAERMAKYIEGRRNKAVLYLRVAETGDKPTDIPKSDINVDRTWQNEGVLHQIPHPG